MTRIRIMSLAPLLRTVEFGLRLRHRPARIVRGIMFIVRPVVRDSADYFLRVVTAREGSLCVSPSKTSAASG